MSLGLELIIETIVMSALSQIILNRYVCIQIQCRSKQASTCYVKARPLIKLDQSNIFNLQANCLTVLQHTMSLFKKFHTLMTLNEKLYFQ